MYDSEVSVPAASSVTVDRLENKKRYKQTQKKIKKRKTCGLACNDPDY